MNLIQIVFCFMTLIMIIYSSLINLLESKLPQFASQLFRFGKFATANKSRLVIEVPKSWFKHFYVLAFFEYSFVLWLVTMVYINNMKVPEYIKYLLDIFCGSERVAYTPKHKVYVAICLLTLQVYRRFYDTQKISVFGQKTKMNLAHYVCGLIHYPGAAVAILCEAPIFTNSSGDVVTSDYKLPEGDWFEYLSAPHQTAEILMYSCIMWILWNNITWFFIFTWVLANQVETILLSHWWYQEKFDDFPKKRKALIPFLY